MTILVIAAIAGLVWGVLREAQPGVHRRRPLALAVLIVATLVVCFIAVSVVTYGWAIALMALLVVGLVLFAMGGGYVVLILAMVAALVFAPFANGEEHHQPKPTV